MALDNVQDIYPLSPLQAGMLFHSIEAPAPGMYVLQIRVTLEGPLDPAELTAAWHEVVDRHDALRASFLWEEIDEPLQIVHARVRTPWTMIDGRQLVAREGPGAVERWLDADRLAGFDLRDAPLMRVALVQLQEQRHLLAWTLHHLLADAWSVAIVLDELRAAYHARLRGRPLPLGPAPAYRDFIAWLREQPLESAMPAWRRHLEGIRQPTTLDVLADADAAATRGTHQLHQRHLSAAAAEALARVARGCRVTQTALFQAAWARVVGGFAGTSDVVFGSVVSGRSHGLAGADRAVGLYMNTIPVRVRLDRAPTLRALVEDVHARGLELRPHEHAPLGKIQAWSGVPAGSPLFDTLLIVENHPPSGKGGAEQPLVFRDVEPMDQSNYPLAAFVVPGDETRVLVLSETRVVPPDVSERILAQFVTALEALPAHLDMSPADLPVIPEAERASLETLAAGVDLPPAEAGLVHDRIASIARQQPHAVALVCGSTSLTYRELDDRATAWARDLAARGAGRGTRVAVMLDRGCDAVIAMLAALRAGAAYVPLDPAYPAAHTTRLIEDCRPAAIVTSRALSDHVTAPSVERLLVDDAGREHTANWSPPEVTGDDAAYVIYTSGSTGRPKGVVVTHANLAYSTDARAAFYAGPPGTFLLLSSFAFDSSVAGIYGTLTRGGTLVVSEPGLERDMERLGGALSRHAVTHTLCLPSLYRVMLDLVPPSRLQSLHTVIVAGEAFPPGLAARHRSVLPAASLFNEYGPTEACVWCTAADATRFEAGTPISIGRPIPGAEVRLLTDGGRPAPLGAIGEIVVGGPGVAQGYLDQPDASARVFVTDPRSGRRCYRTGDLGRYLADGSIAFLGRRDRQVKIRGHRIEVDEIEQVLRGHRGVREVAVVAVQGAGASDSPEARLALTGFVVPHDAAGAPSPADLRGYASARLPSFMVPAVIAVVAELPRLPNGKVDQDALVRTTGPAPERATDAPRDEFERALADVWREVLRVERVGVRDDFFALGGDSITSIRIVALARQRGLSLAPSDMFEFPTIAALAESRAATPLAQHEGGRLSLAAAPRADGAPLFMVHGGRRLLMQRTAALEDRRHVHVLLDHRDSGDVHPLASIATLADGYLRAVAAADVDGPFFLGGYSIGAPIAVEMARRLQAAGRPPLMLFLLDPPDDPGNFASAGGFTVESTREPAAHHGHVLTRLAARARQTFVDGASLCLGAAFRAVRRDMPARLRRRYVAKVYDRALRRHALRPYEGPVLIFHSSDARRNADGRTLFHDLEGPHAEAVRIDASHVEFVRNGEVIDRWAKRLSGRLAELDPVREPDADPAAADHAAV